MDTLLANSLTLKLVISKMSLYIDIFLSEYKVWIKNKLNFSAIA